MIKERIKAYTIMELLVGMALSSLVISSAYYSYLTISKEFNRFRNAKSTILELSELNEQLDREFDFSEKILFSNGLLTFNFVDRKTIRYEFWDTFIIRETEGIKDTFDLKLLDIKIEFEGQFNDKNAVPTLIKSLDVKVQLFNNDCHLLFNKNYLPNETIEMILEQE